MGLDFLLKRRKDLIELKNNTIINNQIISSQIIEEEIIEADRLIEEFKKKQLVMPEDC